MKKTDLYEVTTLYVQKNNNHKFDMRYKVNKEFMEKYQGSKFQRLMQRLAVMTGAPKFFGSHLNWRYWFNPVYHIGQFFKLRRHVQVYGTEDDEEN